MGLACEGCVQCSASRTAGWLLSRGSGVQAPHHSHAVLCTLLP